MTEGIAERLEFYSMPEPNSGCLLWIGSCTSAGYGTLTYRQKKYLAHRASWVERRGAIPEGKHVCHKCDVPICINTDHLFLGTRDENMADMVAKRRHPRGAQCSWARLTDKQALEILDDNRSQRAIAKEYGITQSTVWSLKTGKTWVNIRG